MSKDQFNKQLYTIIKILSIPMRILGLDYGKKRIGIAISDEEGKYAFPYQVLENRNKFFVFDNLKIIVQQEKVEKIIVGLPLNLKGEREKKAKECEDFANKLNSYLNLPVELEDERLTSRLSSRLLRDNPSKKAKKKEAIDQQSAILILQGYLDRQNNQ